MFRLAVCTLGQTVPFCYVLLHDEATLCDARAALRDIWDDCPENFSFSLPTVFLGLEPGNFVNISAKQERLEMATAFSPMIHVSYSSSQTSTPPISASQSPRAPEICDPLTPPASPPAASTVTLDQFIRIKYQELLDTHKDKPINERPIAYDASECEEITVLPNGFIKRLDARRAKKTSAPTSITPTEVKPAVDPSRFNFTKIQDEERILSLWLAQSQYSVTTNKFPVCRNHLLLVSSSLRPQVLTHGDLLAIREFLSLSQFRLCFNSWSAASSVNHFHLQMVGESVPVENMELEACSKCSDGDTVFHVKDHPSRCIVRSITQVDALWAHVQKLQDSNTPHNLVCTPTHSYLFTRNPDPSKRGQELYGVEAGVFEMAGIFTTFSLDNFDRLSSHRMGTILRETTDSQCPVEA